MATEKHFLAPGTKVYVPAVRRYYVVEDTCVECSEDWRRNKPHVDLYVSGSGKKLAECEDRLTIKSAPRLVSPAAWDSSEARLSAATSKRRASTKFSGYCPPPNC